MSRLFPELDGSASAPALIEPSMASAIRDQAVIGDEVLEIVAEAGAHRPPPVPSVVGGERAMRKYEQLLGLSTSLGGRIVSARVFADSRLELELLGAGIERTTVAFGAPGASNSFASTPGFSLFFKGSSASPALVELLQRAAQRLEKATLRTLVKVILTDPEKRLDGLATTNPQPDVAVDSAATSLLHEMKSLVQDYGSSSAWRNFFAQQEQQRNYCQSLSGSSVLVAHEDLECAWATPQAGDGSFSFFNHAGIHERADQGDSREIGRPQFQELISDLHDLDVIKGGTRKLDRALDSILEWEHKPDTVFVRATCVPIVIGDDTEGSVERFRKKSGLNVVYLNNVSDRHATPLRQTFRQIRDSAEFKTPEKIPGSINLVGFPHSEMKPLVAFLRELGIAINCELLPNVELSVLKRYMAAEVTVVFDATLYDKAIEEVLGEADLPLLRTAAPFGVHHTRQWLHAVATAVGRHARFDDLWNERFGEHEERWKRLCEQATGYRLGFVVDEQSVPLLAEPRRFMGIPMLAMLQEAGFGVDILVFAPADRKTRPMASVDRLASENVRVSLFSTPAELSAQLRDSRAQAFYSEMFFDRRLTRSGKGQFSCALFRLGMDGAVGTLEQLLAVCRMPFYRRYSRYLGEAFHV